MLQSISEWQRDKVDWSGKNADFSKKLNGVIKPLHPSTNPEIFAEDQSISFWASGAPEATIKNK